MLEEMQQLLAYMDTHYGEDITLSFAAEKMNFSESYFSRVFKRAKGMPPSKYIAAQSENADAPASEEA